MLRSIGEKMKKYLFKGCVSLTVLIFIFFITYCNKKDSGKAEKIRIISELALNTKKQKFGLIKSIPITSDNFRISETNSTITLESLFCLNVDTVDLIILETSGAGKYDTNIQLEIVFPYGMSYTFSLNGEKESEKCSAFQINNFYPISNFAKKIIINLQGDISKIIPDKISFLQDKRNIYNKRGYVCGDELILSENEIFEKKIVTKSASFILFYANVTKSLYKIDEEFSGKLSMEIGKTKHTILLKHLANEFNNSPAIYKIFLPNKIKGKLKFTANLTNADSIIITNPLIIPEKNESNKPNVFIFVMDALRADHLGIYGFGGNHNKQLEDFVKDSVIFEKAYSAAPWTGASMASNLTALYPPSHGLLENTDRISNDCIQLPEILRNNGYLTYCVSANGFIGEWPSGIYKGFDYLYQFPAFIPLQPHYHRAEDVINVFIQDLPIIKGFPLFALLFVVDPHDPYSPLDPYGYNSPELNIVNGKQISEKMIREHNLYNGAIRYTLNNFASFLNIIKGAGLYDNSYIICLADHGEGFLEHGHVRHGEVLYEEFIRVPLLIKFPNNKYSGKKISTPVSTIDIMPTLFEDLGYDKLKNIDGESLLKLIKGERKRRDTPNLFSFNNRAGFDTIKVFNESYKLIKVLSESYKLIKGNGEYFLFDAINDPNEINQLDNKNEIYESLRRILDEEQKKLLHRKTSIDKNILRSLRSLGYIK